ncbi:unnamed protein product [Cylindrotheca closterium]|uniref:Uncharacterized protein n=1 Tax=Cylindrotheca closterium TaxID=2856 RepID=A0AAD2G5N0_9STRA|nr:unnamed protein product [Cylindrotheca closterium]
MRTRKKARLGFDANGVFVYSASAASNNYLQNQTLLVPRNVRITRVPGSVDRLFESAFEDCQELEEVMLEEGVEGLGRRTFLGCAMLTTVRFPSTLRTILDYAFYDCHSLSSVELPLSIEIIGIGAFENCSSLQHLDLSQHTRCTNIDKCAFQGCSELSVARLPPNIKGLFPMEVFCDCSALTHLRFPPGVTDISPSAVEGCSSLVSLEVPEGLWRLDVVPNITGGSDGIQSCSSLVNLFTPPEQWVVRSMDSLPFPPDFQLGRLAVAWRDLIPKLQRRFVDRPLHKLCYFQTYQYSTQDTILKMRDILEAHPIGAHAAAEQVDTFGMTPMHILMLAETPVMELVQELPTSIIETMIQAKDSFGSTPLDYRCKNAAGRQAIRTWLPTLLQQRLQYIGLEQWRQEVLTEQEKGVTLLVSDDAETSSRQVERVLRKLIQCEIREILSLLEMVLWKTKLLKTTTNDGNNAGDNDVRDGGEEESCISTHRQSCRVHSGISIVVENVLPFLLSSRTSLN